MSREIARIIYVEGLIQGVGFRPFVARLASRFHLKGWVRNTNENVMIKLQGSPLNIEYFIKHIRTEAPKASHIRNMDVEVDDVEPVKDFTIKDSKNNSEEITEISPDIAVCEDCLYDMKHQSHRIDYPFINCTNCGPRFTIITDLPYDRSSTTMHAFEMCDQCRVEYESIMNRRFHAQPIACNHCGPQYVLHVKGSVIHKQDEIIERLVDLFLNGEVIAVKGTGGYHLACDALDNDVVKKLRSSKSREGKPFAVLFRDIDTLKEYAEISPAEEALVSSWRRPVVLLKGKKDLAGEVNAGFNTIGAMLPYMPFHYLLFEKLPLPGIVLTSGNISDEPIVTNDDVAIKKFSKMTAGVLAYDREIHNRTDDSVVTVINDREMVLRRSRGYAPSPVFVGRNVNGILATGAELVNCFCIGKGQKAILSQHIGDLKNLETYEFYQETMNKYSQLFRLRPSLVVHDLHPDYLSTVYALEQNLPAMGVQHHHAHIASCMAENNIDEEIIGICLDGTGYGIDGNTWGGEFMACSYESFRRMYHLDYIALPGGDMAVKKPYRTALSLLYQVFGKDIHNIDIPFMHSINNNELETILSMIDNDINCPLSSGAGRLFDAVAAMTGICTVSTFHAEAPMRLENNIDDGISGCYPFQIKDEIIDVSEMVRDIVDDLENNTSGTIISTRFHNTIINIIFVVAERIRQKTGMNKIALSGGTFQNKYIAGLSETKLREGGFQVFTHHNIPCNDGGIALGQLMIAAKWRELNVFKYTGPGNFS